MGVDKLAWSQLITGKENISSPAFLSWEQFLSGVREFEGGGEVEDRVLFPSTLHPYVDLPVVTTVPSRVTLT